MDNKLRTKDELLKKGELFFIGCRFKKLKYKKTTNYMLEKDLNLNKDEIFRYENNITTPDIDIIYKLADYLNVSVDYLTGNREKLLRIQTEMKKKEERQAYFAIFWFVPLLILNFVNAEAVLEYRNFIVYLFIIGVIHLFAEKIKTKLFLIVIITLIWSSVIIDMFSIIVEKLFQIT